MATQSMQQFTQSCWHFQCDFATWKTLLRFDLSVHLVAHKKITTIYGTLSPSSYWLQVVVGWSSQDDGCLPTIICGIYDIKKIIYIYNLYEIIKRSTSFKALN